MAIRGKANGTLRIAVLGAIASLLALATVPVLSTVASAALKSSTTTLTATAPAYTGEPVVFTATVTHGTTTQSPQGTVTFTITGSDSSTPGCDGGSNVITLQTEVSGGSEAQCSVSAGLFAAASPYTVTATYSGDGVTYSGSDTTLTKTIHPGPTTTTVTPSSTPTVTGQSVTFTATVVAASPATGDPTGQVAFTIAGGGGATASCDGVSNTIMLTGDAAACVVSGGLQADGSPYTVTAVYTDTSVPPNYATSTGVLTQPVSKASVTIGVTGPAGTLVTGQPVSFTASNLTVASPGAGTPTGSILFSVTGANGAVETCDGGNTVPLSGGSATCNFGNGLPANGLSYTVTATLQDPNFKSPVAGSLVQPISRDGTITTMNGVPSGLKVSQAWPDPLQIVINSAAPGGETPSGWVEWAVCPDPITTSAPCTHLPGGSYTLPQATPNEVANHENKISFSVPEGIMKPGFYTINATYEGNSNLAQSTAATGHIEVFPETSSTFLTQSHNPVKQGGRDVLKAVVEAASSASGSLGAPTGTVTFAITGQSSDTLTCGTSGTDVVTISTNSSNQGLAKCVIEAGQLMSADAPYTVTVTYSGDPNFGASGTHGNIKVSTLPY